MNSHRLSARLGIALSTIGVALLSACGGGGSADVGTASEAAGQSPVAAAAQDSTAPAVQNICGVDAVVSSAIPSYSTPANPTMVINDYTTPIALLTSLSGYPYFGSAPTSLSLPMQDLREVAALGYQASTTHSMGVEVSSPFAAGTVACVAGISRVQSGTNADTGQPVDLVSLSSSTIANLPVDIETEAGQPGLKVINGFEFMHNITGQGATAVFRLDSAALTDPTTARICLVAADSITCNAADSIGAEAGQWVLRAPVSQAGVYVLAAASETLPLE